MIPSCAVAILLTVSYVMVSRVPQFRLSMFWRYSIVKVTAKIVPHNVVSDVSLHVSVDLRDQACNMQKIYVSQGRNVGLKSVGIYQFMRG